MSEQITNDPTEWDEMVEISTGWSYWQSKANPDAVSFDAGKSYCLSSEIDAAGDSPAPTYAAAGRMTAAPTGPEPRTDLADLARQRGGCGEVINVDAWCDADAVPSTAGLCDSRDKHLDHAGREPRTDAAVGR